MDGEKRKEYFLLTLTSFLSGFLIFGILAVCGREYLKVPFNSLLTFLIYGLLGGLLFGGMISGILLFGRIIKRQKLFVKVIACVFFPLTLELICQGGILFFVPYGIYNYISMRKGD